MLSFYFLFNSNRRAVKAKTKLHSDWQHGWSAMLSGSINTFHYRSLCADQSCCQSKCSGVLSFFAAAASAQKWHKSVQGLILVQQSWLCAQQKASCTCLWQHDSIFKAFIGSVLCSSFTLMRILFFPVDLSPCVCALIVRSVFRRVKASVFAPHKQLMGIFSLLLLFHPATLKFISHGLFTVRLQHAHLLPCWDMTEGSGWCKSLCLLGPCLSSQNQL